MKDSRPKVHVAGLKGPIQRCIRCSGVLHDQSKYGNGGWKPGAAVVSRRGGMHVAELHELDYSRGLLRPCGSQKNVPPVELLAVTS